MREDEALLLDKAYALIAEKGWWAFTLDAWAAAAGVPTAELKIQFPDKKSVAALIHRDIQDFVFKNVTQEDLLDISPKDRVLELLLLRLEALARHKEAHKSMFEALQKNPMAWPQHLEGLKGDIKELLRFAGIGLKGPLGCAKITGTVFLYIATLSKFYAQIDSDLSPLMAFLDKGLTWCDGQLQRYTIVPDTF